MATDHEGDAAQPSVSSTDPQPSTTEELMELMLQLASSTQQSVVAMADEIAAVHQRLDGVRSVVKDKLHAPADDRHCDPLHGQQPSLEQQMQLFTALAEWQASSPVFVKDRVAAVKAKSGAEFSYAFADLGQATTLAHTASKHGLSTFQVQINGQRQMVVRAYLVHQAGGFIYADAPLFPKSSEGDRRGQDWASGYTFARRYALCSVLGIAAADDDDDNSPSDAQRRTSRPSSPPPVRNTQAPIRPTTATASRARPPAGAGVPSAGTPASPAAPGWSNPPSDPPSGV